MSDKKWWEEAIIYQIYPRSFQDTNEDGVGDIEGILQRLDYVQSLGVNTLWINPLALSPQGDNGYDVIDYKKIDPLFGEQSDGKKLIDEVHTRGMKLIYDFPLHHTSTEHPWFKEAIKGKDNPYRDYYIWADAPEGKPHPTNWTAELGNSVWTKEENGNQFYLHLFKESMADLNWDNPNLREEMLNILDYLIGKGIDGFRCDAFIYMSVDKSFPDHPDKEGPGTEMVEYGERLIEYLNEIKTRIKARNEDILVIGEATSATADITKKYTKPETDRVDKIITLTHFPEDTSQIEDKLPKELQWAPLDLKEFKQIQNEFQEKTPYTGGPILYWNNHDEPRHQHKYGNTKEYRDNSQMMTAALLYLQKGIPIIYYGEEIGMLNFEYTDPEQMNDQEALSFYKEAEKLGWNHDKIMHSLNLTSRDTSRGIMQWDDSKKVGFTKNAAPWTLYNQEEIYNVKDQQENPNSILNFYKQLISLKKTPLFTQGDYQMQETKDHLVVYERKLADQKGWVYCNFSENEEKIELSKECSNAKVVLTNSNNKTENTLMTLSPYGTMVLVK